MAGKDGAGITVCFESVGAVRGGVCGVPDGGGSGERLAGGGVYGYGTEVCEVEGGTAEGCGGRRVCFAFC